MPFTTRKVFATIGVGALKLVEGLGTFVENIGDGLVSIVGFTGGLFNSDFKNSPFSLSFNHHPTRLNKTLILYNIAFYIAKESEIKNLRMVLTGKLAGTAEETIKERLRETYV